MDETQESARDVDTLSYVAPRMTLTSCPRILTTYDGFEVRGTVRGSEVEGAEVEVTVAGVTRTSTVHDGTWVVRFEDEALSRHHAGVRPVTGRVTDRSFNTAQATEWVTIEEFVDGFVHVDALTELEDGPAADRHLIATGELGLGSHDDVEGVAVSAGLVEPGWHHGEWRARVPLREVTAGAYRVRAVLTDKRCASLTRVGLGEPFELR